MNKKNLSILACMMLVAITIPIVTGEIQNPIAKPADAEITHSKFYQIDWYDGGEIHTIYSSWGRMDIDVVPDPNIPYYLNVVAIAFTEPIWIIQNYPILPEIYGGSHYQAVHFNIADFGIPEGDILWYLYALIDVNSNPLSDPPEGDFQEFSVNSLIRDAWGHGDDPPSPVGEPVGHRADGDAFNVTEHQNVPFVQEDFDNCIAGSYARSIKWLDNEYNLPNLPNDATGQDVYDNLTGLGIGIGTGMGKTEEEMLTLKTDYLKGLDNRSITKFVDYGFLGNVPNASEVQVNNLSNWLSKELKTEDIEMCFDSHCVTIIGIYKQADGKVFLKYRDDERQGNDLAGDNRTKEGELVNDSGVWKFKGSKVDYVVSESINTAPNKPEKPQGETHGSPGEEYEYKTKATDPNGDKVYYKWDWGDGTMSDWLGPFESGEEVSEEHTWNEKGNYPVRVKTKDEYGAESDWSNPLDVEMPRNKALNYHPLLLQFLEQHPNMFPILRALVLFGL